MSATLTAIINYQKIPPLRFKDEDGRIRNGCQLNGYMEITTPRGTFSAGSGQFVIDFGGDNLGIFKAGDGDWIPEYAWPAEEIVEAEEAAPDTSEIVPPKPPEVLLFKGQDIDKMSINEVRESLSECGLSAGGRKTDLVLKLKRYVRHPIETLDSEE